jgi:hypothetical protein
MPEIFDREQLSLLSRGKQNHRFQKGQLTLLSFLLQKQKLGVLASWREKTLRP